MDVSMLTLVDKKVVGGLSGRDPEWWKLKLDKGISISPLSSSFPSCSPLWFALSVILDARKNTNLFFMAILMFCLNGSPLSKEENKPQLHLLNKREESLSYLLYEKHFLHSFLHVWIPYSLLTMKWLKLKRRKAHTFNLIFWHNSVVVPHTIEFEIINSWVQKLLWIAP